MSTVTLDQIIAALRYALMALSLIAPAHAATLTINGCATYTVSGPDSAGNVSAICQNSPPPTTPPPSPTDPSSCPGFSRTHTIDIPWGPPASGNVRVNTANFGGFRSGEIVVARFTTPSATSAGYAKLSGLESNAAYAVNRTASLSTEPCSFTAPAGKYSTMVGVSFYFTYGVGTSSSSYTNLRPNTTYYVNIKNEKNGVATCPSGVSCDMFIELPKPFGL